MLSTNKLNNSDRVENIRNVIKEICTYIINKCEKYDRNPLINTHAYDTVLASTDLRYLSNYLIKGIQKSSGVSLNDVNFITEDGWALALIDHINKHSDTYKLFGIYIGEYKSYHKPHRAYYNNYLLCKTLSEDSDCTSLFVKDENRWM